MCGIIGYVGNKPAYPILISGLKSLEYRGYDSFGFATVSDHNICTYKNIGAISEVNNEVDKKNIKNNLPGCIGIGHTRWATHGIPSIKNAHPHLDCNNIIAVVHNGIIENYAVIKNNLERNGHCFKSETDTEIIPHLMEDMGIENVVEQLNGAFTFLSISTKNKEIVGYKYKSPLVMGITDHGYIFASDAIAILPYTNKIVYFEDGDLIKADNTNYIVYNNGSAVLRNFIELSREDISDISGYKHFMLKEIIEEQDVILNARSNEFPILKNDITIIGCGSSYYAGLVGKYIIEQELGLKVSVEFASELKYSRTKINSTIIAISQSGETADTLAALNKFRGYKIGITNTVGSSITKAVDNVIYLRCGYEISVAATKSFLSEIVALSTLCNINLDSITLHIKESTTIDVSDAVELLYKKQSVFYIGRGIFYPIMLEGALKLKEISYIHAECFAAGEIKHGPFALLSEDTPVIVANFPGSTYSVTNANINEIKSRCSPIIIVGERDDKELMKLADVYIGVSPGRCIDHVFKTTTLLQRIAYYTALKRGCPIDKPRNLAKCVTVE